MKLSLNRWIAASLCLPLSICVLAAALNAQTAQTSSKSIVEHTVHSTILAEDRRILVRLPRRYQLDSTNRYAVLYKFDGDNQLEHYDNTIAILNSMDAMPDLIVVAIPNARGQRNRDLTPATLHQEAGTEGGMGTGPMGRGDRFLDFVLQELIPWIDKQYRTTAERLLAGHSRGALMVLQSMMSTPDVFQARFVFSAPLTRDKQRMIADTRKFFREHPNHKSFLYCNWGEAENEGMTQSYNLLRELLTREAPEGLRWTIERAREANHQQTQPLALPSALYDYFAGRSDGRHLNRTARITSDSVSRKPR